MEERESLFCSVPDTTQVTVNIVNSVYVCLHTHIERDGERLDRPMSSGLWWADDDDDIHIVNVIKQDYYA
jgi:hypothetical protein